MRSGIGAIDIVDDDKICLSNLNRQLYALHSTIGRDKVDVAEERIHDINPDCKVTKWKTFYMPDTANLFDFAQYDYIVDCIDTVTGKLDQTRPCHRPKDNQTALRKSSRYHTTHKTISDAPDTKAERPCRIHKTQRDREDDNER